MKFLRILLNILKKPICWISRQYKLYKIDRNFYLSPGVRDFYMFPPSFYRKHTPEEIEEITRRELDEIRAMVAEYDKKYNKKS
ncbi:MAG: hypothetical protein IJ794_02180 [Lachnospiraceae bacterium]|nr:hypothetical protein [Lachnospiraceae bacterium]MBR1851977.1 hypothetical protein [Lachnospiraceae bacterium]